MAKDFIYSDDEQVIRRYSVFEAKGKKKKKKGVTIIVTNKRVISTAYQNGVLSNATKNKEVLIENISGDIMTSINRKVNLFKIILFGILALFFLISGGIIGIVLGLIMIALFVLSIVFPTTEGKIEIANKGMIYNGIYAAGGRIIRGRDIFSITDIILLYLSLSNSTFINRSLNVLQLNERINLHLLIISDESPIIFSYLFKLSIL